MSEPSTPAPHQLEFNDRAGVQRSQARLSVNLQVHLRVDTTLTNNKLDVVAYVARHLTLGDRTTSLAQEFQQVPCEVKTVEVERLGSKPAV